MSLSKLRNSTSAQFERRLDLLKQADNYDTFHYLFERFEFHPPNSHFEPIRYEIKDCLTFGLDQASITLTNHYLEKFLKISIIQHEISLNLGDLKTYKDKAKSITKLYSGMVLHETINKAHSIGIISDDEKEQLTYLKNQFRNPFSHSDSVKTFGTDKTTLHKFSISNPSKIEDTIEIDIAEFIPFQGIRQKEIAKASSFAFFIYIDNICMNLEIKGFPECLKLQPNKSIDFIGVFRTYL